jgi:hypothetical protein
LVEVVVIGENDAVGVVMVGPRDGRRKNEMMWIDGSKRELRV